VLMRYGNCIAAVALYFGAKYCCKRDNMLQKKRNQIVQLV